MPAGYVRCPAYIWYWLIRLSTSIGLVGQAQTRKTKQDADNYHRVFIIYMAGVLQKAQRPGNLMPTTLIVK